MFEDITYPIKLFFKQGRAAIYKEFLSDAELREIEMENWEDNSRWSLKDDFEEGYYKEQERRIAEVIKKAQDEPPVSLDYSLDIAELLNQAKLEILKNINKNKKDSCFPLLEEDLALIEALSEMCTKEPTIISHKRFEMILSSHTPIHPRPIYVTEWDATPQECYKSPFETTSSDFVDKNYWLGLCNWCKQEDIVFALAYSCRNAVDICLATFDYIFREGYRVKECESCGKFFVATRVNAKCCSTECKKAKNTKRMAAYRKTDEGRCYDKIYALLRQHYGEASEELDNFANEWRQWSEDKKTHKISKEEMIDHFNCYHKEVLAKFKLERRTKL